eukprot:jgi/Psemu1/309166/fgenesh1_kg.479_\
MSSTTTNLTTKPAPFDLTKEQVDDFLRDGVIIVRGLLHGELLENAIQAAETMNIPKIPGNTTYRNLAMQSYRTNETFRKVAFDSAAPTICAKLMGLDDEERTAGGTGTGTGVGRSLRLLKDGLFGFGPGNKGCGWHVDDKFFWPCEDIHNDADDDADCESRSDHEPRRRDAGVNVWITLSPVTAAEGGGLAVAPGSHDLTGSGDIGKLTRRARRTIAAKGGYTTCLLESLAPDYHDELETIKRVYDLEPGDAIVHDRYVFHRADPFRENENENEKFRISLRYMPSDATYFNSGYGTDPAVTEKHLETGDPLWKAGEFFPQVWPSTLEEEVSALA